MSANYNFSLVKLTLFVFVDGQSQKCFVQKMYSFCVFSF